ncbi:MAG: LPS export ABC transporter permease LptF [Alphaproteobacteria bacterium]|nr:LPS export ABC transporter permease LptF [Alphaproteobacteria bacterium]
MKLFDWYVLRNLFVATIFVSITLTVVIFLTQSLRFLELVVESGASSSSFWILTFLALPRFFEIILPLSLMASTIFIYNRMTMDSELIAIRSVGYSPLTLARPAIMLALLVTILLWSITMWIAPKSLANMHEMRQIIKAQFSTMLFREGVFNQVGKGLTVYIRERASEGELHGIMIHDSREKAKNPSTVLAKRGVLILKDDGSGHQVVVYDGSRQEYDSKSDTFHKLNFERYTIDLSESGTIRQRWHEPDERTIFELMNPDKNNTRDIENLREFKIEIHRRFTSPLLALSFTLISCCSLLIGPVDRRGQSMRIITAIICIVIIQGLFLSTFNLARQTDWALPFMYILAFVPTIFALFLLSGMGENLRRRLLYVRKSML